MSIIKMLATVSALLATALAVSACGGGDSGARPNVSVEPSPANLNELRAAILDGNSITGNSKIARAVESDDSSDLISDSARVSYSWVGDDISIDIAGTTAGVKPIALEEETSVHWETASRGNAARVSVGKTKDGVHTIAMTLVDSYLDDSADHAAWGYWLSVNNPSPGAVDVGAFFVGTRLEGNPAFLPVGSGDVAYYKAYYSREGGAVGLHVVEYPEDDSWNFRGKTAMAEFSADVELIADFGDTLTLEGKINNFQYYPPYEVTLENGSLLRSADNRHPDWEDSGKRPYEVKFESDIDSNGTFSTGDVEMKKVEGFCCADPVETTGVVSGKFSVDLGRIGGTFRTQTEFKSGAVGQYIGAFVADEDTRRKTLMPPVPTPMR